MIDEADRDGDGEVNEAQMRPSDRWSEVFVLRAEGSKWDQRYGSYPPA